MNARTKWVTGGITAALLAIAVCLWLQMRKEARYEVIEFAARRTHNDFDRAPAVQNARKATARLAEVAPEKPPAPTAAEAWQEAVLAITVDDIQAYLQRKRQWNSIASSQRFLERANLPPEAAKELKAALVDKAMLDYDLRVTARQMGLSTDSADFANLLAAEKQRIRERITSLVDERFYNAVDAQLDNNAYLVYSSETFAQAYEEGVPFSPEQRTAFEDIQWQLNRRNIRAVDYPVDPTTGFTEYDEEMFRRASGLLSAAQMDVFKRMRKEFNLYRDNYRQVKEHHDIFHGKLPQLAR